MQRPRLEIALRQPVKRSSPYEAVMGKYRSNTDITYIRGVIR